MRKICLFGANGRTGVKMLCEGGKNDYKIRAAVRQKESLDPFTDDIEVAEYSFDNPSTVREAMEGCDVVVSTIGSGDYAAAAKPTTLYSRSVKVLIDAMKETRIKRLIVVSSAGTEHDANSPWYYRSFFRPWLMNSYMDMIKMETIVEESAGDLEWTLVRPTYLLDGNSKEYLVKDRKIETGNFKINRIDLASFILKKSYNNEWIRKHPVLGYA